MTNTILVFLVLIILFQGWQISNLIKLARDHQDIMNDILRVLNIHEIAIHKNIDIIEDNVRSRGWTESYIDVLSKAVTQLQEKACRDLIGKRRN